MLPSCCHHAQTGSIGSPLQLLRPALLLAPSYFCLNYTYFFSLDLTSVSSTMILSASTGVWTLLFSRLLLGEKLTRPKLATVAVSLIGMSLVVLSSHHSHGREGTAAAGGHAASGSATPHSAHSATAHSAASPAARHGRRLFGRRLGQHPVDEAEDSGLMGDVLALMSAAASVS